MRKGFTLVELAAVLVIVALILAGVAAGSSLVQQSEMQSVISDFQMFRKAYYDFTLRYKQIPGDMATASTNWASGCAITITCNGNGNSRIETIWQTNTDEVARAWKHLSLAQLIPQGINVIPAAYLGVVNVGDFTPASKVQGAGYFMSSGTAIGGDSAGTQLASPWSSDILINAVFIGRKTVSTTSAGLTYGSMNATFAYNVDKKIDDGKTDATGNAIGFNTGRIRALNATSGGTNCINAGVTSYVATSSVEACILGYQLNDRNL